ncbi:hypothetical protein PNOK_0605700 [Pyrrhoderma noxium]|uniref:Uncharacterized protein n=1 Tax=Pyrrhoderma noxium TaxID=2282107 RepID=A0A286UHX5_9AGAM|nr:hypothetical protein PNOK_0605700 [Pyrrhoderma noxium]
MALICLVKGQLAFFMFPETKSRLRRSVKISFTFDFCHQHPISRAQLSVNIAPCPQINQRCDGYSTTIPKYSIIRTIDKLHRTNLSYFYFHRSAKDNFQGTLTQTL